MAPTQPNLDEKGRELATKGCSSRFAGVCKVNKRFQANARIDKKTHYLGTFETEEEAADRVKECKANPELIKKSRDSKTTKIATDAAEDKTNNSENKELLEELPKSPQKRRRLGKKTTPNATEQDSKDNLPGCSPSPLGLLDQFRLDEVTTPQRQSTATGTWIAYNSACADTHNTTMPQQKQQGPSGAQKLSQNPQKQTGLLSFFSRPKAPLTNVQDSVAKQAETVAKQSGSSEEQSPTPVPKQEAKDSETKIAASSAKQSSRQAPKQEAKALAKDSETKIAASSAKQSSRQAPKQEAKSLAKAPEKAPAKTPAKAPTNETSKATTQQSFHDALEGLNILSYTGTSDDEASC